MSKLRRILRVKQITPDMVCGMPDTLFVFDDNMQRISQSSQANALRKEPNVIALPTDGIQAVKRRLSSTMTTGSRTGSSRRPATCSTGSSAD